MPQEKSGFEILQDNVNGRFGILDEIEINAHRKVLISAPKLPYQIPTV